MAGAEPKRKPGRPSGKSDAELVYFKLPKDDFEYLTYLTAQQKRLGDSIHDAARAIIIREVAAMRRVDYHLKQTPRRRAPDDSEGKEEA